MTFQEWLYSFIKKPPIKYHLKVRKSVLLKNNNDINYYFIYYITLMLGRYIDKIILSKGEYKIYVKDVSDIEKVLFFLKKNIICQFKVLIDVCGVDFLGKKKDRFEINYNLLSIRYCMRLHVKAQVCEFIAVPSITNIYKSANWYEREVWDMFGIFFKNHPDLRRILTDYGFDGFPLRKDFPQTGYVELRYNNEQRHLIYEPVELSQDFRNFDFISPWNQIK